MLFVCYSVAEGFWEEPSAIVINQEFSEARINRFFIQINYFYFLGHPALKFVIYSEVFPQTVHSLMLEFILSGNTAEEEGRRLFCSFDMNRVTSAMFAVNLAIYNI